KGQLDPGRGAAIATAGDEQDDERQPTEASHDGEESHESPTQARTRMDFALTEQQELIRKEVATLARSFPADYWLEKDESGEYPWEFVKAFAAGGWLGAVIPEEYGGSRPWGRPRGLF